MNLNFELILFYATLITGVIALFDWLVLSRNRGKSKPLPKMIDYAYAFFPVLLLVFVIRSFLFEPFRIPSGSLEPTLSIGDFILVNKFDYGIRLPVIHKKIVNLNEPERGDIVVFRWPPNPKVDFIKRVIGIPGDKISYVDKVLTINGQKIPQEFKRYAVEETSDNSSPQVVEKTEDLLGVKHQIYQGPDKLTSDFHDIIVPKGMYFMMGDNRDDSADSRYWGFVPEANIVGKAKVVWMSWDSNENKINWHRIGMGIH